jgi:hypothetical protein
MPTKAEYQIVVVELDDVVARRHPSKPNLYVGIASADGGGIDEVIQGAPAWVRGSNLSLRPDLAPTTRFATKQRATEKKKALAARLMASGFTVNRNHGEIFRLYVIELQSLDEDTPAVSEVYVGETSKSIEARFEQHKQGGEFAVRRVTERGTRLRHDLIPKQLYFSRDASRAAEARLAEKLRFRGFKVHGGH